MQDTPEPWLVGQDYYGGVSIRTAPNRATNIVGDDAIFENTGRGAGDMAKVDARRIVACVNACAGIPNDALPFIANAWKDAQAKAEGRE